LIGTVGVDGGGFPGVAMGTGAALEAVVATMKMGKQRELGVLEDRELEELNRQMLRATWEAGLPTATGVAAALAELPARRSSASRVGF
jgi:hypothetical protein